MTVSPWPGRAFTESVADLDPAPLEFAGDSRDPDPETMGFPRGHHGAWGNALKKGAHAAGGIEHPDGGHVFSREKSPTGANPKNMQAQVFNKAYAHARVGDKVLIQHNIRGSDSSMGGPQTSVNEIGHVHGTIVEKTDRNPNEKSLYGIRGTGPMNSFKVHDPSTGQTHDISPNNARTIHVNPSQSTVDEVLHKKR